MTLDEIKATLSGGLIVSCHMHGTEPQQSDEINLWLVKSAELGGAVGIRVEGAENVAALRKHVTMPIIAFAHGKYADGLDLITPEYDDIRKLYDAGADVVAVDATKRKRPNGTDGFLFFEEARRRFAQPLWADCSAFREGVKAAEAGADFVATTLSGHTPGTAGIDHKRPDYTFIHDLSQALTIPVIAEGRIWTPEDAVHAIECGAFSVVVGTAITRPKVITQMFVNSLKFRTRNH